ncbi:SRPBCC domain-containing protein [Blastococcus litoris]|uniref:SRPBCC domain-containing protein n=1 Tax=Blastococcus litoris TaxID=2171622 RepID=UPI000E304C98|nr:SRPBCC domain-containing protein [Blastococcus litoris]
MRHHIGTEIDIEAPPAEVWRHLVDLAAYPEWNPFIPSAAGTVAVGERLTLRLQPPGGRALPIRPAVTAVTPGSVLEWLGHLGVPGLFDGRHRFELFPTPGGTHLVQSESFSGVLVRPLRALLDGGTRAGFEAMNDALRTRALDGRAD